MKKITAYIFTMLFSLIAIAQTANENGKEKQIPAEKEHFEQNKNNPALCFYYEIRGTDTVKIALPSDFPVKESGNPKAQEIFDNQVKTLLLNHPELASVLFFPTQTPYEEGIFIEIPKSVFETYTSVRKENITKMAPFYVVAGSK